MVGRAPLMRGGMQAQRNPGHRDQGEGRTRQQRRTPSASPISAAAGRDITTDWPKSPCNMPESQRQYCTSSGSFRPSFASSAATLAGVAYSPRMA